MRSMLSTALGIISVIGILTVTLGDDKKAKAPPEPKPPVAKTGSSEADKIAELEVVTNSLGMKLVKIPPGTFMMGSDKGNEDELPVHRVTLTKPFYLGVTEVTQAQYEEVIGDNPSQHLGRTDLPVDTVSWEKAAEFCAKLSEREGLKYRLPTEAEWEWACRAGSTGRFGLGDGGVSPTEESIEEYAWFRMNTPETQPVAQKKPNAWGMYDMHGNVFEWCQDNWLDYSNKPVIDPVAIAAKINKSKSEWFVLRGGSWEWGVEDGTASARCHCTRLLRSRTVGLRVARTP
ncbi:MAG: formylglycine-generating enzyme family protein [Planctomycetes bacterium]|nr:formylglycine-generating enzyme family protein [Planctomycetota bacterium]